MDIITYALCKQYVQSTAEALGAVKGAPCTIKSTEVSPDGKSTTITFSWMSNTTPSTEQTTEITINNGSVVSVNQIQNSGTKIAEITIDGTKTDIYAPAGGSGGRSSELTADLDVTTAVGGIPGGKHYAEGTSLEAILRDLLCPVVYPTLDNPSAGLSMASGSFLLEKGSNFNTTITINFNRGSINPTYGTSGYRSGPATSYALNGGAAQQSNTFNIVVTESVPYYQGTVNYSAGEQPKDSAGNDYSLPYPAGSIETNAIAFEFVNALWANVASADTVDKLALVSKAVKQKVFNFPTCPAATPETFDVPVDWTITAIEVKNELTGEYEDCANEFTLSSITHLDAGSATVNYARYINNRNADIGARDIRIKWA